MPMRIVLIGIFALLVGCATSKEMYLPDGSKGHNISCDGSANSMGNCFQKAGDFWNSAPERRASGLSRISPPPGTSPPKMQWPWKKISQLIQVIAKSLFCACRALPISTISIRCGWNRT